MQNLEKRKLRSCFALFPKILLGILIILFSFNIIRGFCNRYYQMSGSSRHDLEESLISLGYNTYEKKELMRTQLNSGETLVVYEDVQFSFSFHSIQFWNDGMPLTDTNGNPFNKSALISVYDCVVDTSRYIEMGGEIISESVTHQYKNYTAYEDTDLNSRTIATIDPSSLKILYSDDASYFNNFVRQGDG